MATTQDKDLGGDVCYSAAMSIFHACMEEGHFVAFDCWNWESESGHVKFVSTFHFELDSSLYLWMLESAARFFKIGEDMPGRIFQHGQHEACMDVNTLSQEKIFFSRKQKAIQHKLCTYLGVPVFGSNSNTPGVRYVLGFYGRERPADSHDWACRIKKVLSKIYSCSHMCEWMDYHLLIGCEIKSKNPIRRRKPQVKQKCSRNDENCQCRICVIKRNNREYARRSQRRRAQAVAELPVLHQKLAKQGSELFELKYAFDEQRKMLYQALETIKLLYSGKKTAFACKDESNMVSLLEYDGFCGSQI